MYADSIALPKDVRLEAVDDGKGLAEDSCGIAGVSASFGIANGAVKVLNVRCHICVSSYESIKSRRV